MLPRKQFSDNLKQKKKKQIYIYIESQKGVFD